MPSPRTQILVLPGGGAAARVPDGTMAIEQRGAPFNLHITSLWREPADDERNVAWTRALGAALKPFTTGRVYVNFIGDEGRERAVACFGADGYARLQAIKRPLRPRQPVPRPARTSGRARTEAIRSDRAEPRRAVAQPAGVQER